MDEVGGELCLIDAGIQNLCDLPLQPHLHTLNLHSNLISSIQNLYLLKHLRHLDLSSNHITEIQGLEGLVSLRTLNLSCNKIITVEGIENLRSLVKLNLSYNQIEDLSGFQVIRDGSYKLSQVELHGNRVQVPSHVARCLNGCVNLRKLSLAHSGVDNPACHKTDYRNIVLSALPRLEMLDDMDRSGQHVSDQDNILADIPGLDNYLDYLVSTSSSDVNPVALATPHIDAALQLFQFRGATTPEMSTATEHDSSQLETSYHETPSKQTTPRKHTPRKHRQTKREGANKGKPEEMTLKLSGDHELRIEKLEHQLCQLLYGDKSTGPGGGSSANTDTKPQETKSQTKAQTKPKTHSTKQPSLKVKVTRHTAKKKKVPTATLR